MQSRAAVYRMVWNVALTLVVTLAATWAVLGRPSIGTAIVLSGLAAFFSYRRENNLDPQPAWLFIGLGAGALVLYGVATLLTGLPEASDERLYFALVVSVPLVLLIVGIRKHLRSR